jgi:hypothetical protein
MKKLLAAFAFVICCSGWSLAQKGVAEADYYPLGYALDTWTGEVTAVDNEQRTLTLTYGKNKLTFIATIPDAPYEWRRNKRNERVLDFPYDPKAKSQPYKFEGPSEGVALLLPSGDESAGTKTVPNPPDSNRITDLSDFVGRTVMVYYTARERNEPDGKVKFNDVWRVKVFKKK